MEHEFSARERVGRFSSRSEAQVARAMLSEHGIEAAVDADDAAGLHPELSLATGGITLSVAVDDVEEARELLADVEAGDPHHRLRPRRRARGWILLVAAVLVAITLIAALSDIPMLSA
jgi:hypothetical protein